MKICRAQYEDKTYSIIEALKILNIDNQKRYLNEEEFFEIYKLYRGVIYDKENINLKKHLRGIRLTIKQYNTVEEWENAPSNEKIFIDRRHHSNLLYYFIMVLAGRVKVDANIINQYNLPQILSEKEKKLILNSAKEIGFYKSEQVDKRLLQSFNKLRFYMLKDLKEITEEDFYNFNNNIKHIVSNKVFNILKYWGNIPEKSMYFNHIKKNRSYVIDYVETSHKELETIYFQFKSFIYNLENKETALKKVMIFQRFIKWLNINYSNISNIENIEYMHISLFISDLKEGKYKNGKSYSIQTINSEISRFKYGILKYLLINNMLSEELTIKVFSNDAEYNKLYYPKVRGLPKPVPIKDRVSIEKALFKEYDDIDNAMLDILRICYLIGARPSEVLSLKVNCIKGVEQVSSLHIHRTKGFKERYVPLIDEAYKIIEYWAKRNSDSLPIYLEYDKEVSKRLFQIRGKVYALGTIERVFSDIMLKNNIVDSENRPKYQLYILRKIRITTWLENGLSEEEVAYLVGHDNIDSHNSYIVSKELRKKNAKKVYNELYKDILEKDIDIKKDVVNTKEVSDTEVNEFINVLEEIENKSLNTVMKKNIIKEFGENVIPLPCGKCFAKVYDVNFECAMMDLPCLECSQFIREEININILNNYVKELFISRENKRKNKLDGLIKKVENQIQKVKKFYVEKLGQSEEEVDILFKGIKDTIKVKRGRPKKGRV